MNQQAKGTVEQKIDFARDIEQMLRAKYPEADIQRYGGRLRLTMPCWNSAEYVQGFDINIVADRSMLKKE